MHNGSRNMKGSQKAKNFKEAIKRLLWEIRDFKKLVIISLLLAAFGSILSIMAPDKLSNLTDEITQGLVINTDHLESLTNHVTESFNEESIAKIVSNIINIDLSEKKMKEILSSDEISSEDKEKFQEIINSLVNDNEQSNYFDYIAQIPDSILLEILNPTEYQNVDISIKDQVQFIQLLEDEFKGIMPKSIASIFFSEITIDNVTISAYEQAEFLSLMSIVDQDDPNDLYSKFNLMPKNIQTLVEPKMDMEKIMLITLFIAGLYICSSIFTYIESISMTKVSNNFAKKLRTRISIKINKLPLQYFDQHSIGDTLSRVTNDVDTIAQTMNHSLASLVSALTLFIGTIIMMFWTNWIMAITAILSSMIGFIFMFLVLGKSQKYFVQRQVELGKINGHIEEIYSGLNIVKAYNGQEDADEKFDELNNNLYNANRKSQFLSGLMMPMMNFIGNFGYVAVCIVGALLVLNDYITFGVIVAFISYVRLFTSPLSQIAQAMTNLQSTAAASERVFEFLDEKEMSSQKNIYKKLSTEHILGSIEFENVTFTYEGNEKPTINNFNACIKPGQKVAIVGPTGAGKSTLVNLLMKFYEINSGDIKIDNVSTKELSRENIRELFTMVLQDTWLFNGTIKENIIYNKDSIDDKQLEEICKLIGLDHFIRTLPQGYETYLEDFNNISSGERQLLTIARGMLDNAPFLILDEATSNVDTRTEELVQSAMDKLMEGKTSFIIAHRLSTIKNADLILVMKDGNIIEQGTHQSLMNKAGFYAELYNSQFEI